MSHSRPLVVHIASGDRWAGAEVQVYTLVTQLHRARLATVTAILMNEGELATRLRAQGITVVVLDESRLGFFALLAGTWRALRARRPDLVHTHRQKENLLGVLAAWPLGLPSVRPGHGAPESAPPSRIKPAHDANLPLKRATPPEFCGWMRGCPHCLDVDSVWYGDDVGAGQALLQLRGKVS